MCCVDLGPPAAVDQLQARDSATPVVGAQDDMAKGPVPDNSRREVVQALPSCLELKGRLLPFVDLRN
jgi:hypothetical protein